jgi:apolipoprotein D and lipocalin family protein
MKKFTHILSLLGATVLPLILMPASTEGSEGDDFNPVTAVSRVELSRYTGLWHEIAKIPSRFQEQCVRGSTAEYTLREDGRLTVVNRCVEQDGEVSEAKGEARTVDTTSNAQLEVSFFSILGWRPFWGDYWVLGLDSDYRWAAIGDPERKYGWILARTPTLQAATLDEIFVILERNGYRRDRFEMSLP